MSPVAIVLKGLSLNSHMFCIIVVLFVGLAKAWTYILTSLLYELIKLGKNSVSLFRKMEELLVASVIELALKYNDL